VGSEWHVPRACDGPKFVSHRIDASIGAQCCAGVGGAAAGSVAEAELAAAMGEHYVACALRLRLAAVGRNYGVNFAMPHATAASCQWPRTRGVPLHGPHNRNISCLSFAGAAILIAGGAPAAAGSAASIATDGACWGSGALLTHHALVIAPKTQPIYAVYAVQSLLLSSQRSSRNSSLALPPQSSQPQCSDWL